jgi:hypothetical protein
MPDGPRDVARMISAIEPSDGVERSHQADVLAWLDSTPDIYRRAGSPALPVALDPREFAGGRWWTGPQIETSNPDLFDPNMGRFRAKIRAMLG